MKPAAPVRRIRAAIAPQYPRPGRGRKRHWRPGPGSGSFADHATCLRTRRPVIDIHAHLMPGVDDGARDDEEAGAALAHLRAEGFDAVTATPHLDASLVDRGEAWDAALARFDAAWDRLLLLRAGRAPGLKLHRGVELMLDTPEPVVTDARVRLGGGAAVLVEFPRVAVPPSMPAVLERLRLDGYVPVVAHPERYEVALTGQAEAWRAAGAVLAVNGRALLGRYGAGLQRAAHALFARGLVDLVATDYHGRGDACGALVRAALERSADADVVSLLTTENPARVLRGATPYPIPAMRFRAGLLGRLLDLFR